MPIDENQDRGDAPELNGVNTGDTPGDTGDTEKDKPAVKDEGQTEADKKTLGLDEKEDKKDEPRIPKSRFDEGIAKARREAETATKRADELEAQLKANQGIVDVEKLESRIDDAEEELEKARADGNAEKAAALRREIRSINRQISDSAAAAHAARATAVAVEQIRYGALVSQMEVEHPELNPDLEDQYDQAVVDELTEFKSAFEAAGHSSSESLKKALKAVYRGGPAPKKEAAKDDAGEEETAEELEAKAKKATDAAKLASERKEAAIAKALADKKKQPSDTKKAGLDSDKAGQKGLDKPVSKMSEKEFDALPEDERKRLRGDTL